MSTWLEANVRCVICGLEYEKIPGGGHQTALAVDNPHVTLRVGDEILLPETIQMIRARDYYEVGCVPTPPPRERLVALEPWFCRRGCDQNVRRNALRLRVEHGKIVELESVGFEAEEVRRAGFVSLEFGLWDALIPMMARMVPGVDWDTVAGLTVEEMFYAVCKGSHPLLDECLDDDE